MVCARCVQWLAPYMLVFFGQKSAHHERAFCEAKALWGIRTVYTFEMLRLTAFQHLPLYAFAISGSAQRTRNPVL